MNGKSQGRKMMPALLPQGVVGCLGTCAGIATVAAVAPARFAAGAKSHGKHVAIAGGGASASWSKGLPGCNEVALLEHTNMSFSVKLGGSATFVDFGWCAPSIDPSGSWPSPAPAGWMGEQGTGEAWIFRKAGTFKASTDAAPGAGGGDSFCLETVTTTDRGQVRPWEAATLSTCSKPCADSSWAPSCGGSVFFDTELGLLRTAADTTGMCFGVCEKQPLLEHGAAADATDATDAAAIKSSTSTSGLALPKLFSDNMVLDFRAPAAHGHAAPGSTVTVSFNGAVAKATAAADGAWRAQLGAAACHGMPRSAVLSVAAGTGAASSPEVVEEMSFKNVACGQLFVCTGQVRVCVCACVRVRACVRACARACVRGLCVVHACARACVPRIVRAHH
eukprot:SAG22_NODE_212_length_15072_cov_3.109197_5_plen_392_part_00